MDHNETTCCFSSTNTTTITTPYITDEVDNSQINRVYSPVTWFKELQITILSWNLVTNMLPKKKRDIIESEHSH